MFCLILLLGHIALVTELMTRLGIVIAPFWQQVKGRNPSGLNCAISL